MACVVKGCTEYSRSKALMCSRHWYAIPITLRDQVRTGTEKGLHSLRVQPSREWLALAAKYVGEIKHLTVRVGADHKVKRNFDAKPQEDTSIQA